jgi:hypothetical protein
MYTAVILYPGDQQKLLAHLSNEFPPWWEVLCHHFTISLTSLENSPCAGRLGEKVEMIVKSFAIGENVAAVGIETAIPSNNAIKHITVAVDRYAGGKPAYSNKLTNWKPIAELKIYGEICEVN